MKQKKKYHRIENNYIPNEMNHAERMRLSQE